MSRRAQLLARHGREAAAHATHHPPLRDPGQSEEANDYPRDLRRDGGEVSVLPYCWADLEGTFSCCRHRTRTWILGSVRHSTMHNTDSLFCLCSSCTPFPSSLRSFARLRTQQSVRHHLSLNRLFERQPRPVTDPGFGSYWTVNLDAPPGTKRPRKRGRPNRETDSAHPRKRGRPRKAPGEGLHAGSSARDDEEYSDIEPPLTGLHRMDINGGAYEDGMDYMPDGIPRLRSVRADEYDDDDDDGTPPPNIILGPNPFSVSPGGTHGPFGENMNILDRLKQEMDNMRRREASAMAERQRMSDQLAEAQADASRARAAQRSAEKMLREEEQLRRDEERLRRDAEGQLREMQVRLSETLRGSDGSQY